MDHDLQRLAERLDLAVEAAGIGIWDWDIPENRLVWNDGMYRLYGIRREDFHGAYEAWLAGLHPDDRASSDEASRIARETGADYGTEFRVVWPSGEVRWLEAHGRVFSDAAGRAVRMLGVNFDITARKRAEEQRIAQVDRETFLARLSLAFAEAGPDIGALLARLASQIVPRIADLCQLHLLSQDDRRLDCALVRALDPEVEAAVRTTASTVGTEEGTSGMIDEVYRKGHTVFLPLIDKAAYRAIATPQVAAAYEGHLPHSLLVVPLVAAGRTIGILGVTRYRPGRDSFTEDDRRFGTDIAGRLAMALMNARQFESLQRELAERARHERRIGHLSRIYAVLSQVNQAIVRATDASRLYEGICGIALRFGGFRMARIGLLEERPGESPRLVTGAIEGDDNGVVRRIELRLDDPAVAQYPAVRCVREARCVTSSDVDAEDPALGWPGVAKQAGIRAIAAVPFRRSGRIAGYLSVNSAEPFEFEAEEEALFLEIAGDISYALDMIDREAARTAGVAALEESERRYRTVADHTFDWEYWRAPDGSTLYMSPSCERITGRPAADFIADPGLVLAIAHPDDRVLLAEHQQSHALADETLLSLEFRILRPDGEVRWMHHVCHGIFEDGRYLGRRACNADITEQRLAVAAELAAKEQHGRALQDAIGALAYAAEMRDAYTAGHQQRVAAVAVAVAEALGLPQQTVEGLRIAATIHDIGKLGIPTEVLVRPGGLTGLELSLVRTHSQAGYELLRRIDFPWPVAEIVRQHHERMDGSGYPGGLRGDAILIEARVLAVADVVEAMSSHRPYRPALGVEAALAEIEAGSGSRYDADVSEACVRVFRGGFRIPEPAGGAA